MHKIVLIFLSNAKSQIEINFQWGKILRLPHGHGLVMPQRLNTANMNFIYAQLSLGFPAVTMRMLSVVCQHVPTTCLQKTVASPKFTSFYHSLLIYPFAYCVRQSNWPSNPARMLHLDLGFGETFPSLSLSQSISVSVII